MGEQPVKSNFPPSQKQSSSASHPKGRKVAIWDHCFWVFVLIAGEISVEPNCTLDLPIFWSRNQFPLRYGVRCSWQCPLLPNWKDSGSNCTNLKDNTRKDSTQTKFYELFQCWRKLGWNRRCWTRPLSSHYDVEKECQSSYFYLEKNKIIHFNLNYYN